MEKYAKNSEIRIALSDIPYKNKKHEDKSKKLFLSLEENQSYLDLRDSYQESSIQAAFDSLVVILKTTRLCNLRCVYCNQWKAGPGQVMDFNILVKLIRDAQWGIQPKHISYVFHGGEPTLLPTEYYEKFIWLTEQFKLTGQCIDFSMQTNGTLLDAKWVEFLEKNNISIGISLDGPSEINDLRRLDKKGRPTTEKVLRSIDLINKTHIKYGVLIVVDDSIFNFGPDRLLEFFIKNNVKNIGILNQIPENIELSHGIIEKTFISFEKYIDFMTDLFIKWWSSYRDDISIREFDDLLRPFEKKTAPELCYFKGNCIGKYITIDPNGDVSACDKFINLEKYFYGNLHNSANLVDLLNTSKQIEASWEETEWTISSEMKSCPWFDSICRGGCPHDRRFNYLLNNKSKSKCCGLQPLLNKIQSLHSSAQCS